MFFNVRMTIWILAFLCLAGAALAGWRQGAIRAAFSFVGILIAALLAALAGKVFGLLLPYFGVTNPVTLWVLSPICGFALVLIFFKIAAQSVHKKIEVHHRYQVSDLQRTLWERLNARLGICVGLLNGALYFVLLSFVL
jgi:phosphate/sulfate permease